MGKTGDSVTFDPAGAFVEGTGVSAADLVTLAPRLEDARRAIVSGDFHAGHVGDADSGGFASKCAFFELPERLLDDYVERRESSDLGRILRTARRLRERVDRVVVLGARGVGLIPRAILDACCEPYFNELTRGQRGGRPRFYFADDHLDNDAAAGLLMLLTEGRSPDRLEDRWAIVACDQCGENWRANATFRLLSNALRTFYRGDTKRLDESIVPLTRAGSRLGQASGADFFQEPRGLDRYSVPDGIEGGFSVFSAVGLLPAAIAGLDVVRLLEGASAMNDHFRTSNVGSNSILDFVGVGHLMQQRGTSATRILRVWAKALESVARWYVRLREDEVGSGPHFSVASEDAATPVSALLQGSARATWRDVWVTNLIVQQWRCDALPVESRDSDRLGFNPLAETTWPDLLSAAIQESAASARQRACPACDIRLARLNEFTLGQLMQMWMLATAVERHLRSADNTGKSEKIGVGISRIE
ncbi:MAG: glucose-6-phosphate isomerase [Pirellulaceae bacterium]|nr:glucose-6-phosphate isomerase [Pirellulaceae bacterium]